MRRRAVAGAALAAAFAVASPTTAQWPEYRVPGIPRTADGKPNLDAPAPRTADGHPDLSGLWENFRRGGVQSPNAGFLEPPPSLIDQFRDIGTGLAGGLPLTPWAAALKAQRMADHGRDNPDAHCLPLGLMQLHTHPDPRRIVQTPSLIVFIYEANSGLRQIFMDGRTLPPNDPQPWWYGYSVGHWDRDALVVETTHLRDGGWLDVNGTPLTDTARVTERFRRPTFGSLDVEVTIDDPKAYTRPWTVTIVQRLVVDREMMEFICLENEKSSSHYR